MKSKEWLRKEIHILRERDAIDGWTHSRLLSIINQLPDEREHLENAYEDMLKRQEFEFDGKEYKVVEKTKTLSQEWIDKNTYIVKNRYTDEFYSAVRAEDLQNLIVNKSEITKEQVQKYADENDLIIFNREELEKQIVKNFEEWLEEILEEEPRRRYGGRRQ